MLSDLKIDHGGMASTRKQKNKISIKGLKKSRSFEHKKWFK